MKTFGNNLFQKNSEQPKLPNQAPVNTILNDYSNTVQRVASNQVMQMKWVKVRGTESQYYWSQPTTPDIATLPSGGQVVPDPHPPIDDRAGNPQTHSGGGGFFMPGGTDRMVTMHGVTSVSKGTAFDTATTPHDTRSYFGGSLEIHHRGDGIGQQSIGAPLPANLNASGPALAPTQETAWWQDEESQLPQKTKRRGEKTIMGESANEALSRSGIAPQPYAPFAHIQPDHTHPTDREDRSLRHPTYEATNQAHSAMETGVKNFVNNNGPIGVGRQQVDPIPGGNGLFAGMNMQLAMPGSHGFDFLNHYQPHLSSAGGRSGDASAITDFLQYEYYRNISRDAGIPEEEMKGGEDEHSDVGEEEDDDYDVQDDDEGIEDYGAGEEEEDYYGAQDDDEGVEDYDIGEQEEDEYGVQDDDEGAEDYAEEDDNGGMTYYDGEEDQDPENLD